MLKIKLKHGPQPNKLDTSIKTGLNPEQKGYFKMSRFQHVVFQPTDVYYGEWAENTSCRGLALVKISQSGVNTSLKISMRWFSERLVQ